ncbi:MAG: hypothetical protein JXQ93_06225 [Flavobacteriaceae bacterium]
MKFIKLLLFTIATSFSCYSQQTDTDEDIDGLLDELFFNDQKFLDDFLATLTERDFIYTTVSYSSNTFFAGRDSGTDQFNIIPQITYYDSSGFNASVATAYYQEQSPNWDFVSLSAGYANFFNKSRTLSYNLNYSRFFYSDGWDAFNNSLDIGLGYRNTSNTFGTLFSASYLFGTDNSVQLISRVYGNISLLRQDNYIIRFKPQVNFIVASQTVSFVRPTNMGPVLVSNEYFDLLNTQINFPIAYTTKSWDFELSWNLNLPSAVETEQSLDTTNFFSFSIGYLLDVGKKK